MTSKRNPRLERITSHWLFRYGLAIVLFATVIGLSLLGGYLGAKPNMTIPVVAGLVMTAWYGGFGPAVLISVLYQGTTILYAAVPPDQSTAKTWFGYFSVFALYLFIALVTAGLKRSKKRIAEQRDLLQVTLSSIGDAVVSTDRRATITFMNAAAEELTGWTAADAVGLPLTEVVKIVNENSQVDDANPVARVLETGNVVNLANHSVLISKTGRKIPIDDCAAPIKDGGEIRGVVLVFSDVSERKKAERAHRETEIMHRLVEAQEADRQRIARDLHDHLGQRMTGLRLRIEALADRPGIDEEIANAMTELRTSALQIDRDISFLSWELRPTELELLGLENAVGSFVHEWSRHHQVAAEFHTDLRSDAPLGLSKTAETNLYRIVQESLNNVLKHANANRVNVLLQQRGDHVSLIVEDDGSGFERTSGALTGPGGLGLIGMRERAALLDGTLEIEGHPGEGTTILAKIPMPRVSSLSVD